MTGAAAGRFALEAIRIVERQEDHHACLALRYKTGVEAPSWTASDGTFRLLALTLIAYLPDEGVVHLLEEPENGIHPMAIDCVHGSGPSREDTQAEVEGRLASDGWQGRSKAIVIAPEVEAWVWTRSARLPEILGWRDDRAHLQDWLTRRGFWPEDRPIPPDPKKAMREALARRSSDRFFHLAGETALRGCRDPAFGELRDTLRTWFPGGSAPAGGGER